jgi:hypothetical protein
LGAIPRPMLSGARTRKRRSQAPARGERRLRLSRRSATWWSRGRRAPTSTTTA